MAIGTAWRTALGAVSALALGALGVAFVPPLLVPGAPAVDTQVAATPDAADAQVAATPDAEPDIDAQVAAIPEPSVSEPAAAPVAEADPVPEQDPAPEIAISPEPEEAQAAPEPEVEPAAPETPAPIFDTVRVELDGTGLVAGQAEPGSTVSLLADDAVAAEATADADGRFVAFFALPPSAQPRVLSLQSDGGAMSAETVIVAPNAAEEEVAALDPAARATPEPGAPAVQEPKSETAEAPAAEPASPQEPADAGLPAPQPLASEPEAPPTVTATLPADPAAPDPAALAVPSAEPAPAAVPAPEVAAVAPPPPAPVEDQPPAQEAVLLSDAEGVRVVQPALAPGASPEVLATVALDAIAYDGAGEVVLSGRATDQGAVRLYLDNAPVADAAIGPDGSWTVPLTGTAPGVYTLRVDQLDAQGGVVSRIETPFQREERVSLEAALAEAGRIANGIALRTVQPGNTLWAIARERYGEPRLYLRVFEANRDRIRNPDLIYPGQVFVLPDIE